VEGKVSNSNFPFSIFHSRPFQFPVARVIVPLYLRDRLPVNFTKISENPKDFNAGVYLRWPPGETKNNEITLYFSFIANASDLCGLRGRTNCFGK